MKPEEIEDHWNNPDNHRWGAYYCPEDPRIIVPRRVRWMGWTINFARPGSFPTLVLMFVWIVVPYDLIRMIGGGLVAGLITGAMSIAILCLLCAHLSSTARWNR